MYSSSQFVAYPIAYLMLQWWLSVLTLLSYWSEGQRFNHWLHQVATVGPLNKALNYRSAVKRLTLTQAHCAVMRAELTTKYTWLLTGEVSQVFQQSQTPALH